MIKMKRKAWTRCKRRWNFQTRLYCCVIDILRLTIKLCDIELELHCHKRRRHHLNGSSSKTSFAKSPIATNSPRLRAASCQGQSDIFGSSNRSVSSVLSAVRCSDEPPSYPIQNYRACYVSPPKDRPNSLANDKRDYPRGDSPCLIWQGSPSYRFVSLDRSCIACVYQDRTSSRVLSAIIEFNYFVESHLRRMGGLAISREKGLLYNLRTFIIFFFSKGSF